MKYSSVCSFLNYFSSLKKKKIVIVATKVSEMNFVIGMENRKSCSEREHLHTQPRVEFVIMTPVFQDTNFTYHSLSILYSSVYHHSVKDCHDDSHCYIVDSLAQTCMVCLQHNAVARPVQAGPFPSSPIGCQICPHPPLTKVQTHLTSL